MIDKVIVTNTAALAGKYQASGLRAIRKALQALVEADRTRGVETQVVELDDTKAMKKLKVAPVLDVGSARQNKAAIDAVYRALTPDYLMILGAPDVVPHQDLRNPACGDQRFDKRIGKHVVGDGFIIGDTLLADSVTLIKDQRGSQSVRPASAAAAGAYACGRVDVSRQRLVALRVAPMVCRRGISSAPGLPMPALECP